MAQQSSVEWLFETLAKTPMTEWYQVREQAKEMHKEETLRFIETMPAYLDINKEGVAYVQYNAEEHYNNTYNKM